jgi:hypothetical protein
MPQPPRKEPEVKTDPSDDFASEHATAGFTASLPVTAGFESLGVVEGFDPDQVTVLQALQRRLERRPRRRPQR